MAIVHNLTSCAQDPTAGPVTEVQTNSSSAAPLYAQNDDHDQETAVGIDSGQKVALLLAKVRSNSVPTQGLHPNEPLTLRRLRTWYHLAKGHTIGSDGNLDPPVNRFDDQVFIQYVFRLGLGLDELDDMDLPLKVETVNVFPSIHRSKSPSPEIDMDDDDVIVNVTRGSTPEATSANILADEGSPSSIMTDPSVTNTVAGDNSLLVVPRSALPERVTKRPREDNECVHLCFSR
jgi:hypothetical protein